VRKATARFNFTKKSLDALRAPSEKYATYYDEQARGLGLVVQTTGHRAFFWFRKVQGHPTWKTIGTFPDLSIENARARADEYNTSIANWKSKEYEGLGPFEKPKSSTLSVVFEDYLARHLSVNSKNTDRAAKDTRWQFDRFLTSWKNRKLSSIRREHVRDLHDKVGRNNGHYSANRLVSLIRVLFNWAIKTDAWQGENPTKGIQLFHEESRTRFTQPDEFPRLFKALRVAENLDLRDFVYLALYTGARRGNVLAMKWEQLSQTATGKREWTIPNPKNRRAYTVPLVAEAVRVLKDRRRRIKSPWVFPSRSKLGHIMDLKYAWKKFLADAKLTDLRVHDLRRTLGSWQAGAGVSLPIIGKTLGHTSSDATEIYARLQLDPVRTSIEMATRAMLKAGNSRRKLLEAPRG
jgi:integrase